MVERPFQCRSPGWIGYAQARRPWRLSRRNADLIAELWRGDGSHASFAGFPILGRRPGCQDDRGSGATSGRFVQIRKQGVAVSQGELDEQVLGVAAPIRDARGSVVVAVSIAALASRVPRGRLKSVEVAVPQQYPNSLPSWTSDRLGAAPKATRRCRERRRHSREHPTMASHADHRGKIRFPG